MTEILPEEKRKEIFRLLVEAQDEGDSVQNSGMRVAERFKISVDALRGIEREGIGRQWLPLLAGMF